MTFTEAYEKIQGGAETPGYDIALRFIVDAIQQGYRLYKIKDIEDCIRKSPCDDCIDSVPLISDLRRLGK